MKLFLDGRAPFGGIGRHVRWLRNSLTERLDPRHLAIYPSRDSGADSPPRQRVWPRSAAGSLKRIAVDQFKLPKLVQKSGADLFHSPNYLAPARLAIPSIVDCYDLTLLDQFDTKKWGPMKRYERRVLLGGLERARCVVTPSETVRRQLLERFDLQPERVTAIYPPLPEFGTPLDETAVPEPARGPFFLSVGVLEPRKNLERVLDAHERVWRETRVPLILAGPYGWRQRQLLNRIESSGGAVHWLGWVPDAVLGALYRRATAVVQASLAEGFDLPVLEGLAAGAPLILSELPVHREVAGDLGAYAPSLGVNDLASRMREILDWSPENRASLAGHAVARAGAVAHLSGIERYLEVYKKALC